MLFIIGAWYRIPERESRRTQACRKKVDGKGRPSARFFDILRLVKTMFHDVLYGGRRPATVKVSTGQHTRHCPTTLISQNHKTRQTGTFPSFSTI
ncbi:hypothetical protein NPIL_72151 [Nephila pilipes]|uniref:Uncharacterized protein n=1 Tax=Nephila pilipes TaxID=299642 RepID=A0A8X6NHI9_NEPPI|nr:hypothetical protein NPIL_72151 [Nephila pilipes]